jgi:3-oxoacyl-[acyl-carrier-protein] synthase III
MPLNLRPMDNKSIIVHACKLIQFKYSSTGYNSVKKPGRNFCHIGQEKDFSSYAYLGNMGTVSLPLTAALASQRGFLQAGQRVAFLGIGSGLNCMMLGWQW